jgi:outer membrane immunogenic protein
MKFRILSFSSAALLAFCIFAAPAKAIERPHKHPPAPPPPPPSWTGWYFGANIGVGIAPTKFYDIFGPLPDYALDADQKMKGWLGGFQLGYNYQVGNWVVGAQGNFDWANVTKHDFSCFSFGNQTCSSTDEWIASVTGRIGPLIGPALLYIDGGPAWTRNTITNIAHSAACVPTGGTTVCSAPGDLFIGSKVLPGWTLGGGMEYRVSPNWSWFVEYDYFDFGSHPIGLSDGGTGFFPEQVKQQLQLVKLGFDYHLNNGPIGSAMPLGYAPAPALLPDDDDGTGKNIRAFATVDVGKDSVDALMGGLFAFSKDIDTSGPRLWITGGSGTYSFPSDNGRIRGIYATGDLLAGYGFEGNNYEINLLAGGSAENDMLNAYDATDPVNGTAVGAKVRGDVWVNPTTKSMVYGEAEYTTAFQTYYTSAKYGYDLFNRGFFVGPEAAAFGDQRFDQWRLGAHLTQLKFWSIEFDVSAGFAHDSVVGNGAYGHLEMSKQF